LQAHTLCSQVEVWVAVLASFISACPCLAEVHSCVTLVLHPFLQVQGLRQPLLRV